MSEKFWMIKHPDLAFSRPISQSDLIEKIQSGELQPRDEICPSGGYWFSLNDVAEVRKHLGEIALDGLRSGSHEDITQDRLGVTKTAINVGTQKPKSNTDQPQQKLLMKIMIFILAVAVLSMLLMVVLGSPETNLPPK